MTLTIDDDGLVDMACVMETAHVARIADLASSPMGGALEGAAAEHEAVLVGLLGGIRDSLLAHK